MINLTWQKFIDILRVIEEPAMAQRTEKCLMEYGNGFNQQLNSYSLTQLLADLRNCGAFRDIPDYYYRGVYDKLKNFRE